MQRRRHAANPSSIHTPSLSNASPSSDFHLIELRDRLVTANQVRPPVYAPGYDTHAPVHDTHAHGTSTSFSGYRAPSAVPDPRSSPSAATTAYYRHRLPQDTISVFVMKPVVSAVQAWACVVISVFAIVILSILGALFKNNHHEMVGGIEDPEDGPAVAATIFTAVLIYLVFLVFCGLQGMLHLRENRRGAIAL